MIARYADSIGKMMRPGLTLLFTTIAILGMIFGLFSFENHPVLSLVMIVISVLALAGMTTDKFKQLFQRLLRLHSGQIQEAGAPLHPEEMAVGRYCRGFHCTAGSIYEHHTDGYGPQ